LSKKLPETPIRPVFHGSGSRANSLSPPEISILCPTVLVLGPLFDLPCSLKKGRPGGRAGNYHQ